MEYHDPRDLCSFHPLWLVTSTNAVESCKKSLSLWLIVELLHLHLYVDISTKLQRSIQETCEQLFTITFSIFIVLMNIT